MMPVITFLVHGFPKPAGSKRAFFIRKIARSVVVDACKGSRDWKTDVQHAAREHYNGPLLCMPLKVRFDFFVLRPKSHFRAGKNSALLKPSAPGYPAVMPDVLKLARGVEDALTGILWKDDSLIVHETLTKSYASHPGVSISISEMVL